MSLPDIGKIIVPSYLNRRLAGFACVLLLAAGQAGAQAGAPKIETLPAPRSEISARYQADVTAAGIRSDVTYARRITGALPQDKGFQAPKPARAPRGGPVLDGTTAMIVVFVLLLAAGALWLRFGGSGSLLARAPRELRQKPTAPDVWQMQGEVNRPMSDLLAEIAAMTDRRAGLVRLLRHCLLHAAAATNTRFARSDTERQALRRLPGQWGGHADLAGLLQTAELAHYGGRSVAPDVFEQSLAAAHRVLGRNSGKHA
jgi:hypothetical protein